MRYHSAPKVYPGWATRPALIAVIGITSLLLVSACSSTGPRSINLMPAPAAFTGGKINLLPKDQPSLSHNDFGVLYATDRKASDDPTSRPFYLNDEGFIVRLGAAQVQTADATLSWEEARRISLSTERRFGDYRLQIATVQEDGVLETTYNRLTQQPLSVAEADRSAEVFSTRLNRRLNRSSSKDVFVYVPGFRVVFDDPVLVAAELWHFLGYRGAFVTYSWPSTPNVFAYMSDLETASTMARNLRLFLTYLSEETEAERIHIVAYSAGSRLVVRMLEQLALLHADDPVEEIHAKLRIGNVIFVGADISRQAFGAAMMDGLTRVPERTVIYASSSDSALAWSRLIFRRERVGEMWDGGAPPESTAAFLREHPSVEIIDVTDAADSSAGNGHAYFRRSPWVSSDLLSLLAFDLDPAQRGLVREYGALVWNFPPEYIERLQESLIALTREISSRTGNMSNQ